MLRWCVLVRWLESDTGTEHGSAAAVSRACCDSTQAAPRSVARPASAFTQADLHAHVVTI
jgi:hypothetical protein